ncbi:MAG: hypothetical protein C5B56_15450 [Proteobacteria bacterium]|nr:MAG: hypothetical protein C5B56_15450 [Pseudomonadota bacterium]
MRSVHFREANGIRLNLTRICAKAFCTSLHAQACTVLLLTSFRRRVPPRVPVPPELPPPVPPRPLDTTTVYVPHEAIPGASWQHFAGLLDPDRALFPNEAAWAEAVGKARQAREAFSQLDSQSIWDNPVTGKDALLEAMGFKTLPTVEVTGSYKPPEPPGAPWQFNPARVAKAEVELVPGKYGLPELSDQARKRLETAGLLRGYIDAQDSITPTT